MEVTPKKGFGQHFLRDSGVLERLVGLIRPSSEDVFLEVGAGAGALTVRLAPAVGRLFAVELDRDVIPALRQAVAAHPSVSVIADDILRLDVVDLVRDALPGRTLRVVGNLPYNIGTAVIEKFLYTGVSVHDLTFMLQLEVAERIVAGPGSKRYGFLSVQCQHRADARIAFKVHPGSFAPPPRVMSAVVVLRPKAQGVAPASEAGFLEVAKAAFGHRRKTLLNSLRHAPAVAPVAERLLREAGIDGARRPEQLAPDEYETLGRILAQM